MSQLFNHNGNGHFFRGGYNYPLYKRARVGGGLVRVEKNRQTSIDDLPNELLLEILRRVPVGPNKGVCAVVSRLWLVSMSYIQNNVGSDSEEAGGEEGCLAKMLEGMKATDVRLIAAAVGTRYRGGLGMLVIRGNNPTRGVTSFGFGAVSRCCPYLKKLSLTSVPIGDDCLIRIANGCHQLKELGLQNCPMITDEALVAIAKGCPNLTFVFISSCQNVGNEGLMALGKYCSQLAVVSITDCPLVMDHGITGLLSNPSYSVKELQLGRLNITDGSLTVIGQCGIAVRNLVLFSLEHVTEKGFWLMSNGVGLQLLKTLTIKSCRISNNSLEALGKHCPSLTTFWIGKCIFLSDNGLISFAQAATSLKTIKLTECHRVTYNGLFNLIVNCNDKMKKIDISDCIGIKDMPVGSGLWGNARSSLRSLKVTGCPLFGDVNLVLLSMFCTELQYLTLSGLSAISDSGIAPLIKNSDAGLIEVDLSGCVNLTDQTAKHLIKEHGGLLERINLAGCRKITDATLLAVTEDCFLLYNLDVSRCAISDMGISAISRCTQLITLSILSVSGCPLTDNSMPSIARLGFDLRLKSLNLRHCNAMSRGVVDMIDAILHFCDVLK